MSSGLYQCVASNAIGTSTCLLDLQVIARKYFARGGLTTCFCLVTVRCVTMFAVSHHVPLYQKIILLWNENIAFLPAQASCAYRWPQPIPDFFSMLCSIISTAHPRSIGLIAGAVATGAVVLVVCIVLVAVALFYWKNKHKEEEEEEIPNEIR